MSARARIDGRMSPDALRRLIECHLGWALALDFARPDAEARFWYVSEEKLEPRLGDRHSEPGTRLELPLAVGRDMQRLHEALQGSDLATVTEFLARHPEHRHAAHRALSAGHQPCGEVRDNLIGANLRAVDLLRCKLSFLHCTRFDPRSDKWLRITLYQGAPFPDEIGTGDWDNWIWRNGPLAS